MEIRRHFRDSYAVWCGLMLAVSLPSRLANLNDSLWLDEAWVANSLMAPTWREMFFFERFAQSTPPAFLALSRLLAAVAGFSEVALRILPWLAGMAGLVVMAVILRRLFRPSAALAGMALLASNYWIIKHSQQVKQYGTDFLVAALFLVLVVRAVHNGPAGPGLRMAVLGAMAPFLSFVSMFWFPSWLGALLLAAQKRRFGRAAGLALCLTGCLAFCYFVFIKPNQTPALFRSLADSFLRLNEPLVSLRGLDKAVWALLMPVAIWPGRIAVWALEIILLWGVIQSLWNGCRGDRRALAVTMGGVIPLLSAFGVSLAGQYPVLNYPRLLLWALPCLAVLFAAGVSALLAALPDGRFLRLGVPAACLTAVAAGQAAFFLVPHPAEENRPAMEFLLGRMDSADLLFVHGGMYEQFMYYQQRLRWRPDELYLGNTNWPCCAIEWERRTTNPGIRDLSEDARRAAVQARGRNLWMLLPGATMGHWSARLAGQLRALPDVLATQGCQTRERRRFGQTLVLGFSCR